MSTAITELLGADGPLAQALPGFAPRETQQAMAEAVAQAIAERSTLLVEAGTGTGKTFAYLLPALQSGRKVLIATGTRALQDQLFHRDLPTLQRALGLSVHTALLKGRANYLCHHRLE
ncbi:MAG TPA: DEAD/DEAH box helicase, partial [Immundisolibacter sp.]|nr:DEAD/DEAH box helicase [Immundisolibacter sp.]